MQLVIGLGNPGKEYQLTRHNAGFLALDFICQSSDITVISESKKFGALIKEVNSEKTKNLFIYPQTFMNLSGKAVKSILDFYKLTSENILILHDEIDLALGVIKFTESSGSAGHNGVKSLIEELGTQEFRRIRIGIESRENKNEIATDKFVLQNFSDAEIKLLPLNQISARVLLELRSNIHN